MLETTKTEVIAVLLLALLVSTMLPGCGRGSRSDDDTVIIEDNDTIIYGERPTEKAKPHEDTPRPPDYGPKYVSCYDWNDGQPLWGPRPATRLRVEGYYTYIKLYPSGDWIKICAKCYGL